MANHTVPKVEWTVQPVHGGSMTFVNEGKLFLKVGPFDDSHPILLGPNHVASLQDGRTFKDIPDAYSYYNENLKL